MTVVKHRRHQILLVLGFLCVVYGVGITQAIVELTRGERPQCLDLFLQPPSEAHLRLYEKDLEDDSWFANHLRPWTQCARFLALGDTGEKSLLAADSWWFYKPGVQYLVEEAPNTDEVLSSILGFRDRLAERGIHLLVVPAPGKAGIYPDKLTTRATEAMGAIDTHTTRLIRRLRENDVEVLDLAEIFSKARLDSRSEGLYLVQDTHWSPAGMQRAARAVAERLEELGWAQRGQARYRLQPTHIERRGDVLLMMRSPETERLFAPENVECSQVFDTATDEIYRDASDSKILVMGDSFLRIYEHDEPGSAGFVSHLAAELGMPLTSIVNDGGASTLVRQELHRKPEFLDNAKVVIWEFVERDVRFGTEGWQDVPLPKMAAK